MTDKVLLLGRLLDAQQDGGAARPAASPTPVTKTVTPRRPLARPAKASLAPVPDQFEFRSFGPREMPAELSAIVARVTGEPGLCSVDTISEDQTLGFRLNE